MADDYLALYGAGAHPWTAVASPDR
jgi:hypothetical protein